MDYGIFRLWPTLTNSLIIMIALALALDGAFIMIKHDGVRRRELCCHEFCAHMSCRWIVWQHAESFQLAIQVTILGFWGPGWGHVRGCFINHEATSHPASCQTARTSSSQTGLVMSLVSSPAQSIRLHLEWCSPPKIVSPTIQVLEYWLYVYIFKCISLFCYISIICIYIYI